MGQGPGQCAPQRAGPTHCCLPYALPLALAPAAPQGAAYSPYPQTHGYAPMQPNPPFPQGQPQGYPQQSAQGYPAAPPQRYAVIPIPPNEPWRAYGLSQIEYDQIVAIFMTFDRDDSGELDVEELGKLAHWLNYVHRDDDVGAIFRDMDQDGSGTLSLAEFCTWLKYHRPDPQALYGLSQMEYNTVLMQFHSFDSSYRGELSAKDFEKLCLSMHYCQSWQEAQSLFAQVDLNHSGFVDLHELLHVVAATRRCV